MKKIFVVLGLCLLSHITLAQDPDLYQPWYLYTIEFESGEIIDVASFDPPIAPDLTITPSLIFNGIGACNTFNGGFNFIAPDGLQVANFSATGDTCGFFEDMFEDSYFGFFEPGTFMIYDISTEPGGEQTLVLHGGPFTTLTFGNVPILGLPSYHHPGFSIWPNPTSTVINIDLNRNIEVNKRSVISIIGQIVLEDHENSNNLDVTSLSPGIYFLRLFSSEGIHVEKFVKE